MMGVSKNYSLADFCQKYNIKLNEQQQQAVLAVDGATLLLAVPGSGKTTVLIARIGYMIFGKGIKPENILALTYTKAAAKDMQKRFADTFGERIVARVNFHTINSISNIIIKRYCNRQQKKIPQLLEEDRKKKLLSKIYKDVTGDFAGESDIRSLVTEISCIKNKQMKDKDIAETTWETPQLAEIYKAYCTSNGENNRMDYDDQLVYALNILQNDQEMATNLRLSYKYICVDEAQDTSRIQHNIIYLLAAKNNNIFMVGDEDQSIYSYRAAYPQALLRFAKVYANASVLLLEQNYRSGQQIVKVAGQFIQQNQERNEKNMLARRGDSGVVHRVEVDTRLAQYQYLVDVARQNEPGVAILYRENNSAVPLVDLLLREGIPFSMSKYEQTLLGHKITKDIRAFIRLTLNSYDREAFEQIYNKCGLFVSKNTMEWTSKKSRQFNISVFEALQRQMDYVKVFQKEQAKDFKALIKPLQNMTPIQAITHICENGYGDYLDENQFGYSNLELLEILAEQENTLSGFLARLNALEHFYKQKAVGSGILLSTIHSSKGLEFDTVYLMDAYDGILPSTDENDKKLAISYQEERRLFYVAITRAKNNLFLIAIKDRTSVFIEEIMSDEIKRQKWDAASYEYARCRAQVCDKFTQQTAWICDDTGRRWIKCEKCGEINPTASFAVYGGIGRVNLGICNECAKKKY